MIAAHTHRLHIIPRRAGVERRSFATSLRRAGTRLRQALCGLTGHSMMLHFESDRLSLQCFACGAQTPGWQLDVRPEFRPTPRRYPRIVRRAA